MDSTSETTDESSWNDKGADTPGDFVPLLRDIMLAVRDIHPERKVREVVEAFRNDDTILIFPLVDDGVCTGSISRKNLFYRHLSRKYALDLFSNKSIGALRDDNSVMMPPHLDIATALTRLLERDPSLETDCFLLLEGERCVGAVPVSALMMRISEFQGRLLKTLRGMSARIRNEVAHARRIQRNLLPEPRFRFNRLQIGAGITTSTEIGGDFYDYFVCGDNRIGLIIADVSGHGVQSGMVTTAAKASLHTLLSLGVATPAELLSGMNRGITATAGQKLLMTCFIAVVDTENKLISYGNAGHNFPYLFHARSQELEMLQHVSGFPLGFEEESRFFEYSVEFAEGDTLVLYTDGLVECRRGEEEFGYERMERLIRDAVKKAPEEAAQAILAFTSEFAGTPTLEDDATLLIAAFSS